MLQAAANDTHDTPYAQGMQPELVKTSQGLYTLWRQGFRWIGQYVRKEMIHLLTEHDTVRSFGFWIGYFELETLDI